MKWISVSEKLPKINQRILCYQPASDCLPDWVYEGYLGDRWHSVADDGLTWEPTHWMLLPEKPVVLKDFDGYVSKRLSQEEIEEIKRDAKEEYESVCLDFTDECLMDESSCPRGKRIKSALSESAIKKILDNWWSK